MTWPRRTVPRLILAAALAAGLCCRVYVAVTDQGIYWPDEIYQSLEPAHRLVFGYGLIAWEFVLGARNWAFPGFVALLLQACALVGLDNPHVYLLVVRLVFVAMSLLTAIGIYRLARVSGASEAAAAVGGATWALCAPAIYFAHRAMGENVAAFAAVWALSLLLMPGPSRRSLWVGASLLGVAVLGRLQVAMLAAVVLGVLAARRQFRATGHVLLGLGLWAAAYGALDAATWHDVPGARYGGWFHSALLYVRFNVIEGRSAEWGTSPATYYGLYLFRSMPFIAALLAVGLIAGLRAVPGLTAMVVVFVGAHSAVAHKELRFVLPALPLAIAAAVTGLEALPRRVRGGALTGLAVAAILSASTSRFLTWGDLGAHLDRADESAWDDSGPINRLMLAAHDLPDLCGLRVDIHPAWHGGSSYLHRRVRLYHDVAEQSGFYNYAIARAGSGLPVVARDRDMELVKIPHISQCVRDSQYDWGLR